MQRRITKWAIRRVARESFIEAQGDLQHAECLVRDKLNARYGIIDLAVIAAVLQICWILWQFWQSFQVTEPPEAPMEGEPDVGLAG